MKKGFKRPLKKHILNINFLIENQPQKGSIFRRGFEFEKKGSGIKDIKLKEVEKALRKEAKKT